MYVFQIEYLRIWKKKKYFFFLWILWNPDPNNSIGKLASILFWFINTFWDVTSHIMISWQGNIQKAVLWVNHSFNDITWYCDNLHHTRAYSIVWNPLPITLQFVSKSALLLLLASSSFIIYTAAETWSHSQDAVCRVLDAVTTYATVFRRAFILTLLLLDIFLHQVHPNRFSPSA